MLHVDLGELAGGTLQEKFDREITRVIENMQDPNTPFGEKRSITINISFHQTEQRDDAKVEISVKSKLASVISAKTNFATGQMSFSDVTEPEEKAPERPKIASMPRQLKAGTQ